MVLLPCLAVGIIMKLVAVLFALTCIALILIVLVQKGKGGGLSSAFGGGMSGGVLGSKTGEFLTWVTIGLVTVFLLLAIVMAKFYRPSVDDIGGSGVQATAPVDANVAPNMPPVVMDTNTPAMPDPNAG
jgi:preprotein translocase subunit SecG